jgi:RNA polymerase sigma-70 factor (ECF subfamily)
MIASNRQSRLVLLARAGDREALEDLLSSTQTKLLAYISRVVGSTAADDVLQDVLLQICRKLKWLRDPELFLPWSYRIASRECFRMIRRDRRLCEEVLGIEEAEAKAPVEAERQLFLDIPELLEYVSPASRAVLHLHYCEDLPLYDIAAILELDEGTIKSRLSYGLRSLRKHLIRKETI